MTFLANIRTSAGQWFSRIEEEAISGYESVRDWMTAEGSDYAIYIAAAGAIFLVLRFLRGIFSGLFRNRNKPANATRNIIASLLNSTWSLFLLVISAAVVIPFVPEVSEDTISTFNTVLMVALIIQGAVWLRVLIQGVSASYLNRHDMQEGGPGSTAATLVKMLSGFLVWALAITMILTNLGFEIGPILAGLGVGGLAVGLAAQSTFKDLFAALAIIFDKPFVRGDFIKFDDGTYMGEIEKIGMKTTRLRSLTGEQIVVSNSQLLDKEIRNYRRMNERRASHDIGVIYQTPHEHLQHIPNLVERAVGSVEGVRFDRCCFHEFADSSINFNIVFWVESPDYKVFMQRQQEALLGIHREFEDSGISFAYPTRTLFVEGNQADEPDNTGYMNRN